MFQVAFCLCNTELTDSPFVGISVDLFCRQQVNWCVFAKTALHRHKTGNQLTKKLDNYSIDLHQCRPDRELLQSTGKDCVL